MTKILIAILPALAFLSIAVAFAAPAAASCSEAESAICEVRVIGGTDEKFAYYMSKSRKLAIIVNKSELETGNPRTWGTDWYEDFTDPCGFSRDVDTVLDAVVLFANHPVCTNTTDCPGGVCRNMRACDLERVNRPGPDGKLWDDVADSCVDLNSCPGMYSCNESYFNKFEE